MATATRRTLRISNKETAGKGGSELSLADAKPAEVENELNPNSVVSL